MDPLLILIVIVFFLLLFQVPRIISLLLKFFGSSKALILFILVGVVVSILESLKPSNPIEIYQKAKGIVTDSQNVMISFEEDKLDTIGIGKVEFKIPGKMNINRAYKAFCFIDILSESPTPELFRTIMKERIQRLEEDGESEKVQEIHRLLDTIVVSPRLEMRLVDPHDEYFDISPITEEVQTLTMSSPTLWQWSVKALQSGEHSVFLKAVARLKMAEGEEERDIEVYQKQIAIRATATYTVGKFFSSYWEIILTAIIIPAGGWGITQYLKYRKKKKSIQKEREAKENDGYTTDSTQ